jgi:hypothetical protein
VGVYVYVAAGVYCLKHRYGRIRGAAPRQERQRQQKRGALMAGQRLIHPRDMQLAMCAPRVMGRDQHVWHRRVKEFAGGLDRGWIPF